MMFCSVPVSYPPPTHIFCIGLPALVDKNDNFMYVPLYENTSSPQVCGDNQDQYSIGDGVHPNAFGHLRVASVWARTIANYYCPNHRNDQSC